MTGTEIDYEALAKAGYAAAWGRSAESDWNNEYKTFRDDCGTFACAVVAALRDQGFEVALREDIKNAHDYMERLEWCWTPEDRESLRRLGVMLGKPGYGERATLVAAPESAEGGTDEDA